MGIVVDIYIYIYIGGILSSKRVWVKLSGYCSFASPAGRVCRIILNEFVVYIYTCEVHSFIHTSAMAFCGNSCVIILVYC